MSRMEGFFEALSRIPGLTFMEKYAKNIRTARYTVRSGRERAEELSERGKLVKGQAGMKGKDKDGGKGGKGGKAASRELRQRGRKQESAGFDEPAPAKPLRRNRVEDPTQPPTVRDVSPQRDGGRSLRKRKDGF